MGLNKQKGNMYGFVNYTWNVIKGICPHQCSYCYMKGLVKSELHLDEKELKTDLGEGNFIFIGSSTDMFADKIPKEWILKVLEHCKKYPKNKYLFQSKNPKRFEEFLDLFPKNTILGTTIETNRKGFNYNAPEVSERQYHIQQDKFPIMITIEPIMDFDLEIFLAWLKDIKPKWINIGADSKRHNLPEPSWEKVERLIFELKKFTEVKVKDNLWRLKNE